jgi:hypothetical protein
VVDIAALDVMTIQTSGGWDMWVAASSVKAEVATIDEVAFRGADVGVDRDGVQGKPPCASSGY